MRAKWEVVAGKLLAALGTHWVCYFAYFIVEFYGRIFQIDFRD